jgi:hypothetical protein
MQDNNSEVFKLAVMWHLVHFLPFLRQLSFEALKKLGDEVARLAAENPLQYEGKRHFKLTSYGTPETCYSGAQICALMIGVLWVTCGEDQARCSSVYQAWPIAEAVALAPKETQERGSK